MDGRVHVSRSSERRRSGLHIYLLLPGRPDYLRPQPSLLFKLKMRFARQLAAAQREFSRTRFEWRGK